MQTITLKTQAGESKIYIGADALSTRLPLLTAGQKNFVVTDSNVFALYETLLKRYFPETEIFVLSAGEAHKNFQSLYAILQKMAGAGLRRTARLFAVGGGVVGDIGGLAAALYMRGISCVQIPTTLLSQVDSSVGGKTAVDLDGVKNIIGAFYQPCEVWIDTAFLQTLPTREIKCGLGEIVKYAALSGEIFDELENNAEKWQDIQYLTGLITKCVAYKARVVQADEKENGERRCLNIGHTTGHAIELISGLSHGESVLWGMRLETKMAISKGICEKEYGNRLLKIVENALSLSLVEKIQPLRPEELVVRARMDKKNTEDGRITMAVAKAKNEWTSWALTEKEYESALRAALEEK